MKVINLFTFTLILFAQNTLMSQDVRMNPDRFTAFNRKVLYRNDVAYLNAQYKDGLLWLKDSNFDNGTIELDLKGLNNPGKSFVGIAFHGQDDFTFDAIYFRPFNFKNPERNNHSVQYISMPDFDWSVLRNAHPGKYENTIEPTPMPVDEWFHVKLIVDNSTIKVYVNNSDVPTLEVEKIGKFKQGKIGFWVGHDSDGWFKNLSVSPNK